MISYNLINGNIITLNKSLPIANSVTVSNGKITNLNSPNAKYETKDLLGATLIPGFIDAHFHLKNFGKRLELLNLKGVESLDVIIDCVEKKISTLAKNSWLIGFGWDQNLWPNQKYPISDILNNITSNHPVYLTRIDGHSAWVNNMAIEQSGFTLNQIKDIDGGQVINDCIMIDNAMNCFKHCLPKDTKSQVKSWIKIAIKEANKMGITGVHDAWQDSVTIDAIQELIDENEFPIRCYGMLASNDKKLLKKYFSNGHFYNEYLTIRSVKAFIDGALGSRGAALHEPYCDDTNNCGLILISKDEFNQLAEDCFKYKFQLNTHAIGDRGNSYVLDCYGSHVGSNNNRRWRIEHAQMVRDEDLYKFRDYNILPSMQPSHCTSDMPWLFDRIGDERLPLISRWQSFINLGLKIPGGSDCPIETGNPLFEFYAAVTRQTHEGLPPKGWQPQEKISKQSALKMFTSWAAYGGFDEYRRGKIDINYDADFTILSNNLLELNNSQILDTKIIGTIVNGKIVYGTL